MSEPLPNHVLLKAGLRHFVTILIGAVTFGGWLMHEQTEVNGLKKDNENIRTELREWWEWRNGTTVKPEDGITTKIYRLDDIQHKQDQSLHDLWKRVRSIDGKP